MPKSNVKYWKQKIKRNKERDIEVNRELRKEGWRVLRIWEYDISNGVPVQGNFEFNISSLWHSLNFDVWGIYETYQIKPKVIF